jgi:hypothetical protein
MKNSQYKPPKIHRETESTCSVCGLKSKHVSKSTKYNDYFCIDCLVEHIKNNL